MTDAVMLPGVGDGDRDLAIALRGWLEAEVSDDRLGPVGARGDGHQTLTTEVVGSAER